MLEERRIEGVGEKGNTEGVGEGVSDISNNSRHHLERKITEVVVERGESNI